jgi:iron complex transport system substrate-binding protein
LGKVRIASLVPSSTEMLFALGLGDQVVAVTHECDFPVEAAKLPHLSSTSIPEGLSPSAIDAEVKRQVAAGQALYSLDEAVLTAVEPDLIIAQDVCAVCAVSYDDVTEVAARLPSNPVVLRQDPISLGEVLNNAVEVAVATGVTDDGLDLRNAMESRIEAVRLAVAGAPRQKVVALEWLDPPFTGGHWIPEMIEAAGGTNVIGSAGEKSAETTWSELQETKPDIVVVMPCGYYAAEAAIQARQFLDPIRSLGAKQVFAVDATASFSRPGPRLVDGIELLASLLHPDLVPPPAGLVSIPIEQD